MKKLVIDIQPSLVALPFHRLFTTPLVDIDGAETPAVWGTTELAVDTGPHQIRVYFRYRGQRNARLGEGRLEFSVAGPDAETRLKATLGVRNGSSFRIITV